MNGKKAKDIILLALPVIGIFYAMFRMLFVISKHFDSRRSFFGLRFWKFWFSCAFIMLTSALVCSPIIIGYLFMIKFESITLIIIFALLLSVAYGFCAYFLTDLVIKKTKPVNNEEKID